MSFAIVVPARFASQRYPGKPLVPLRGCGGVAKPLVRRSWEAAMAVPGATRVVVATDDARIAEAAMGFGASVAMTPAACANGTERCAAALAALGEADVVVNLQGDAPLTPAAFVQSLVEALAGDPTADVATPVLRCDPALHRRLLDEQRAGRVGGTTVVGDAAGNALYFSKAVIPHVPAHRIDDPVAPVRLHVGVYAYRRAALLAYAAAPVSPLEESEGLEQLRFLDRGTKIRLVEVAAPGHDIWELNNPSDLPLIEQALAARGIA